MEIQHLAILLCGRLKTKARQWPAKGLGGSPVGDTCKNNLLSTFVQRTAGLLVVVMCLAIIGTIVGCGRNNGVTFVVKKAQLSASGTIRLSLETDGETSYRVISLQRGKTGDFLSGETSGGDKSKSSTVVTTGEPALSRFFVKEGETFHIACGDEKALFEFVRGAGDARELVRYIVKVEPAMEESRTKQRGDRLRNLSSDHPNAPPNPPSNASPSK
jgi:hypothetical protein